MTDFLKLFYLEEGVVHAAEKLEDGAVQLRVVRVPLRVAQGVQVLQVPLLFGGFGVWGGKEGVSPRPTGRQSFE